MLDDRLLFVDKFIFGSDGLNHDFIVLREGVKSWSELFLGEWKQQFVQIIHTVL